MIQQFLKNSISKMSPNHTSVGIEITDQAVKLVQLARTNTSNPIFVSSVIEPLPTQCLEEGKILNSIALQQVIQSAFAKLERKPRFIHFALPSPLVMVRFLKLPDVSEKDMAKLVDFEMKHHIHLPFDQPMYDFIKLNGLSEKEINKRKRTITAKQEKEQQTALSEVAAAKEDSLFSLDLDPASNSSSAGASAPCDVVLVAAPHERIQEFRDVFHAVGVKLTSIEIKPFSVYRFLMNTNPILREQTFISVDLDSTTTDVSIYHQGQLKITRTLFIQFPSESEFKLKEEDPFAFLNTSSSSDDFMNACTELSHELERLINFYRFTLNYRDHEFSSVQITGDVPRMDEVKSHVQDRLGQNVAVVDVFKSSTRSIDVAVNTIAIPLGLALRGEQA